MPYNKVKANKKLYNDINTQNTLSDYDSCCSHVVTLSGYPVRQHRSDLIAIYFVRYVFP